MHFTVVADTGAILSLVLSGLFLKCQKEFRIVIGSKIHSELHEIAKISDELGKAAIFALDRVEIIRIKGNYLKGEDEALALLKKLKADILISDDIEFVKKHTNNEKISFSVILLGILIDRNKISKNEFMRAVDSMFEKRGWEENLIYLTAKYIMES